MTDRQTTHAPSFSAQPATELRRLHAESERDEALLRQCLEALEGAEEYDALLDDFTMAAVKAAAVALRERLGEKA